MPFEFTGKKVLITGAGGGLGRELAKTMVNAGAEVYALGRRKENIESLANECSNIHSLVQDLSDWKGTRAVLDKLEVMDYVVNNSAVHHLQDTSLMAATDVSEAMLDETFRLNIMAPINVIQATSKKMIAAGKQGAIVNVSSIAAVSPPSQRLWYNVSKAGLDMVTKQFALELGPHQIRVNSINPTFILTDFVKEFFSMIPVIKQNMLSQTPLGRFCELREVIEPIMYLLSDHSSMVTGTVNLMDGGLLSKLPA